MPFFNRSMASSVRQSTGGGNVPSTRTTRTMPGSTHKDTKNIYKEADPMMADRYKQQMSKRKLLFIQSLIKAQVSQMNNQISTLPVEAYGSLFKKYQINKDIILHRGEHVTIYGAKSPVSNNTSVRVYAKTFADPNTSVYLKILRHLGRKHPYIVHSYELFHDNSSVYIFQEGFYKGNLAEYMEQSQPLTERQAAFWGKQLYRALDFLGDQAIAHRDLSPTHLVIQPQSSSEVWCKLTGFKQAIIYWDINTNDIAYCQCWPSERQASDGANFQAPEVYGDPNTEQFDPIQADIWSYGAIIYYMLVKQYPYNVTDPYDVIDEELLHNIGKNPLSDACKDFIYSLTRGNANDRMPFDFVENHPWMKANSMMLIQNQKDTVISKHDPSMKSSKLVKQPLVIAKEDASGSKISGKSLGSKASMSAGASKYCGAPSKGASGKSRNGSKVSDTKVGRCWCKTGSSVSGASSLEKDSMTSASKSGGSMSGGSKMGGSFSGSNLAGGGMPGSSKNGGSVSG